LNNLRVIPGKLAIASATRNLPPLRLPLSKGGDTVGVLDARFREHDGRETLTYQP
jgi:hypothetical protein